MVFLRFRKTAYFSRSEKYMQWLIDTIVAICKAYTDTVMAAHVIWAKAQIASLYTYIDEQIALQAHVPSGVVMAWTGTFENVPDGWAICDGDNGTPDLADKFIKNTDNPATMHDSGGGYVHTHDFTGDGHAHELTGVGYIRAGSFVSIFTDELAVTGTTDSVSHLPPWYKLVYIMKL